MPLILGGREPFLKRVLDDLLPSLVSPVEGSVTMPANPKID
jgi:hypothetical protein